MKKLLFVVLISLVLANNLYAKGSKGSKGSMSKAPASSKPAAQQKQASTPNQSAQAQPAQAANANAPAAAPNAPAQNPSLLQSAMPALVGGAAGSYIGSKLASDGSDAKAAEENAEKKEEQFLK